MLSSPLDAFDLAKYIDSHRAEWARDQVVRRMVWENADYITFLNRGPTPDPQYHIGPGDEIFFQHEGELHLHYLEGRSQKLRILRPGETLYLPAGVPHSPRRPEGSWTLVVERKRQPGEIDIALSGSARRVRASWLRSARPMADRETTLERVISRRSSPW